MAYSYPKPTDETIDHIRLLGDENSGVRVAALGWLEEFSEPRLEWGESEPRIEHSWFVAIIFRACANALRRWGRRGSVEYGAAGEVMGCVYERFAGWCVRTGPGLEVAGNEDCWQTLGEHLENEIAKSCLLSDRDIQRLRTVSDVLGRADKTLEKLQEQLTEILAAYGAHAVLPDELKHLRDQHGPEAVVQAIAVLVSVYDPVASPQLSKDEQTLATAVLSAVAR